MDFARISRVVGDVPFMTPEQGQLVYRHIIETRATSILELGTAHGTSAAYMAAALDELGGGQIVTVDRDRADYKPGPQETLRRAGLEKYVEIVRVPDSSYTWFLKGQVEAQSDRNGNCAPLHDFCYVDGAHEWTIDGLSVILVEKLLKPGGWLLVDDLSWSYAGSGLRWDRSRMSEAEYREPHMRAVFDLIIAQHPSFTEFVEQDGSWGWARKAPGEPRRHRLETSRSIPALVIDRIKRASLQARSRPK